MSRRPTVAVVGSAAAPPEVEAAAEALGTALADEGWRIVCGGRGGVMAAVCRGARASGRWTDGTTVGILPGLDATAANPWVDVVIPTGLGEARNALVVRAADVVVAVGGGAGTLSEIALAWRAGRPLVALDVGHGWSSRLGGTRLDDQERAPIVRAASVAEVLDMLTDWTDTAAD